MPIVESAVEARGGRMGAPVLVVLAVSTVLAILTMMAVYGVLI